MTSLIAPRHWATEFLTCSRPCTPLRLIEPPIEIPGLAFILPGYSAIGCLLLVIGIVLALRAGSIKSLISLVPMALFVVRGLVDMGGDQVAIALGWEPTKGSLNLGEWLYHVSCSVLFVSFIFSRGDYLRTSAFFALVTVLFALLFYEPDFGMTELLFFVSSTLGARMVFLFLRANLEDFIRIGWARTLLLLLHSIVLLFPIWLMVGAGFWLQTTTAGWVEDKAYSQRPLCTAHILRAGLSEGNNKSLADLEQEFVDGILCQEQATDEASPLDDDVAHLAKNLGLFFKLNTPTADPCVANGYPDPEERDIESDLCYFGELLHAGRQEKLEKALRAQYANTDLRGQSAKDAVYGAVNEAMPDIQIPHEYPCKNFPWLGCEIGKTAKWATENAVNNAQERVRRTVANEAAKQIDKAGDQADALTGLAEENAKAISDAMRRTTQSALLNGFDLMGTIDHVLFVVLCLMVLKALFFVFARVAYSSVDRDTAITLASGGDDLPQGTMTNKGKRYELPNGKFYYSKRAQMEGIAPKIAVPPPQPANCVFGRLFGSGYFLSVADRSSEAAGPVVFKTGNIRDFVEWSLEPGEEVIFHFKDFIAFEDSVKLSTFVSFRLSTLLLGRILFRRASGPGRLILRTAGPAETTVATDTELSKPIHRLVSWNRAARFKLDVERGFFDIYFSTVHLRKDTDSHVIFVAEDNERKTYGTGAARFLTQFLLPI